MRGHSGSSILGSRSAASAGIDLGLRTPRFRGTCDLLESALPGILLVLLEENGNLLALNPAAARYLPALGAPFQEAVIPDDRVSFLTSLADVAGDGEARRVRLRLLPEPGRGQTLHLEAGLSRLGDEGFLLAAGDVSESAEQSRRFRKIIESAAEGIIVHRDGRMLFANQRMAELVGLENAEEIRKLGDIGQFVFPEDRDKVVYNVRERLAGRSAPRDYEFRLLRVDGSFMWVNCRAGLVEWEGELAVVATLFDISEQKRADISRYESEKLFAEAIEMSPDVITLSRSKDGNFFFVNKAFLELLDYKREDVIGRTSHELGIWADPEDRKRMLAEVVRSGTAHDMEFRICRRDGEAFEALMSATMIRFRGEDYLLLGARDVTELKQQQARLRESMMAAELANRAKSNFLANISHELRTPLNAIIGFSEIMHGNTGDRLTLEQCRDYSGDILGAGKHLLSIINDILDISKLEAGQVSFSPGPVDVAEIFERCAGLVAVRAVAAGLVLEVEPVPPGLHILADERRTKQILINLLANAVKFTPAGGTVVLRAEPVGDQVCLEVSDSGIGMNEDELARALTPFGQVDSSLSRRHEGTGLGLPLVAALTDAQDGHFEISSISGKGTTARVCFPEVQVASRD